MAYAFLAVVLVAMILFYFGPSLRDRLAKKPPQPEPPATATSTAPLPGSAPAAVDRTVTVTDELIAFIKAELEDEKRVSAYLRAQIVDKDREILRLRDMDWRRGSS